MPVYKVLDMRIKHGVGDELKIYNPGDEVDLTEEEAAGLNVELKVERDDRMKASEVIELIKECESEEEVKTLVDGDNRKTVIEAAENRIKELTEGDG